MPTRALAAHVEAGKLRLLATWGEQRTARFKDAPNGVGAPRGLDPAVAAKLRDAFRAAVASAEFKQACEKIDAPLLYLDGPDYEKYVLQTFKKETELIRRLNLKALLKS